ncbi:putative T7SS-secreted protein [Streptomyces yangpuensis]|uniref:putative T7SS-secreted protein n=1 Tax=Streptomyces yangpuensis TaxID=1648182 RepID=UPI0037183744
MVEAARKRAREILDEARRQRDDAARAAERAITAATDRAPAKPSTARQIVAEFMDYEGSHALELTHALGGVLKGTAGILNFGRGLNPADPYNLTHPAEYQQHLNMTLAGLVSTAAHPERIPAGLIESLQGDFSEGIGRLFPEFAGTKGSLSGARAGLRVGGEVAENAGRRELSAAAKAEGEAAAASESGLTREGDPPGSSRPEIEAAAAELGLSKTKTKRIAQRMVDMMNTRRDEEWLIRGIVPRDYITGP